MQLSTNKTNDIVLPEAIQMKNDKVQAVYRHVMNLPKGTAIVMGDYIDDYVPKDRRLTRAQFLSLVKAGVLRQKMNPKHDAISGNIYEAVK